MRTTDATLTAAQLAGGDVLCKLVLTSGATTKTYSEGSTNRLLDVRHPETEWSQTAQIVVDNRDGNLTALALEGYKGVISYGYTTSDGDEYSAASPLTVISQKADRMASELTMSFSLAGLFNMMGEDKASVAYTPDDSNTDTVKTILDAVTGATLACFNHTEAHTITYDTGYDDGIIDTFIPADYFSVGLNESKLSVIKKLLRLTKCKTRVSNDSGTATIHIFQPTITGESYDYEYNDAVTGHNFFDKSVRKRLVIPNKVTVSNHPDHEDTYTGTATDSDSHAALGFYLPEFKYARPVSDAQALLIATAILQGYQLARERGHGHAMMNVYQEVMDYVKITDSWANDTRIGNIGSLTRYYRPGKFDFEFRFGSLSTGGLAGTVSPSAPLPIQIAQERAPTYQALVNEIERLYGEVGNRVLIEDFNVLIDAVNWLLDRAEKVPKFHVTDQLIIPVWIPITPTVLTQDIVTFADTTATGLGIIALLGVPNPTAHGVCYNTAGNPNVDDDSTTDEGATSVTGAFATSMTSLSAETTYYVRAYATNSAGTGYGTQVNFTTTA